MDIARGLPRMSICLNTLFVRPLLTFKTGSTVCGYKTLNTTGRTVRPYVSTATVFLFTSIIKLTVPRAASLSSRLPEKGSEGSPCRTSFEGKLLGRLSQLSGSDHRRETKTKNGNAYVGYADLIANFRPEPRTDMSGRSFPSLTPLR